MPFTKTISIDDEGPPVDFCFRETGSYPLIVYATAFGNIIGLDLRSNTPAFSRFRAEFRRITTIGLIPDEIRINTFNFRAEFYRIMYLKINWIKSGLTISI